MDKDVRANEATNVTVIGMVVNVLLTVFKLMGGVFYNSMALIADGVHSLSDLISDIFIVLAFQISKKPADEKHNYGHGRYEVLGEAIVSVTLLIVAVQMIKRGALAINEFNPFEATAPSIIVLIVAFVSIVSKEALYWYTLHYAKKLKSNSMKANAVHHRTDAISSVAVFVALFAAKLHGPTWYILDPIVALCVAAYIIVIAIRILIEAVGVLIDGSVEQKDQDKILSILNGIPNTSDPHHVRTRKIGSYIAIELHIRVNPDMTVRDSHKIACIIEERLREEFGRDTFVSVHIEPEKVNGEYD